MCARDAGWLSGVLVRRVRVGEVLRLAQPMGPMLLDRSSKRDVVMIAGGTGLAPFKAMLGELATFNRTRWVHLFIGATDRDDLYDLPALEQMAQRYPWLSLVPVCSKDPGWGGEEGNLPDAVARYGPWPQHDFAVSGPPAMITSTLHTLKLLQVPHTRVRYDPFTDQCGFYHACTPSTG